MTNTWSRIRNPDTTDRKVISKETLVNLPLLTEAEQQRPKTEKEIEKVRINRDSAISCNLYLFITESMCNYRMST